MTPAEIGPSARDASDSGDSPGGSRTFDSSPLTPILEAVPFGLYVLDAAGVPVYANSRAREILGRELAHDTLPENLAAEYSAFLAGTDVPYPVARMPVVRALSGESSTVSDMEIRRPDASILLEVSGAPVLDAEKRVKYAVAVFSDITATRSVEAALRQLADELEASARERFEQLEALRRGLGDDAFDAGGARDPGTGSQRPDGGFVPCADCIVLKEAEAAKESAALANRALTLFIANFSHELRTPLNHIMGYSDLIESRIESGVTHDIGKHAANIRRSGASLLDTLNKIIAVAEAESSELAVATEIVEIEALLREVAAKYEPLALRNGNRLELRIDSHLGLIQTDSARVRAALEQIVENACKHCSDGTVSVAASRSAAGNHGTIEVSVTDTGCGIDPARAALLVTGRVAPGDPLREAGLGIGIPLAVHSLRAVGGSLQFTAEAGGGTRFVLTIPAYTKK